MATPRMPWMLFDRLWYYNSMWSRRTAADWLLIQCEVVLGFMGYITWLGTFWNSAVPDLMSELGPVVVHVNHIDHNVNGVFYLVTVQVHCMGSQLEKRQTNLDCRTVQARLIHLCSNNILGQTTHSMLTLELLWSRVTIIEKILLSCMYNRNRTSSLLKVQDEERKNCLCCFCHY